VKGMMAVLLLLLVDGVLVCIVDIEFRSGDSLVLE
jgi:hypothetical protein